MKPESGKEMKQNVLPERFVSPGFQVMLKPRGPICNLNCTYCYYRAKEALYPGSSFRMSYELLEDFTRQYIEAQPHAPEVIFAWQGGEPTLMGLDFYRQALEFQRKYSQANSRIVNTLQTNGTLLNDEWCRFFRKHNFLIGVSLDGPSELHNIYRVDREGNPTFDRVMAGIELLKKHDVEFNILTCVHAGNANHPREVYRFLRDEVGARFIQFIPIVERTPEGEITEYSVKPKQYGDFLIKVFDEWVQRDVGRVYVQIFDAALPAWVGLPTGLCIFGRTCGRQLAMEHNGDLYSCDFHVEPDYKLGNIQDRPLIELVNSRQQQEFGLAKWNALPTYCRKCKWLFVCHGGCPRNRFLYTPNGEPGLNYLCEGYKAFFAHIDPAMRFMASELRSGRAPANIMHHLQRAN